ncbi:MAG: replication/maintenance protein RepL [Cetobacterium sp.]
MEHSFLKTASTTIIQTLDSETGELLDQKINKTTYLANTKEEFYLMYSSMVIILKQSSDIKMKLFASLLERYSSGQEFAMNGSLKNLIASETGCNPRSFDNAFTFLVKNNIIVKINSQLYKVNPRHVFQGSSKDRNQELHAIIKLGCKEC